MRPPLASSSCKFRAPTEQFWAVLAELYNNALEHGVVRLEREAKSLSAVCAGNGEYFDEREN